MRPSKAKDKSKVRDRLAKDKVKKRGKQKPKGKPKLLKALKKKNTKKSAKESLQTSKVEVSSLPVEVVKENEETDSQAQLMCKDPKECKYMLFKCHPKYLAVILLKKGQGFAVRGMAALQVLYGTVTVNGYKITVDASDLPLYSLPSSSLYTVQENGSKMPKATKLCSVLDDELMNLLGKTKGALFSQKFASVVLLKRLRCCFYDFISTLKRYQRLTSHELQVLQLDAFPLSTLQTSHWEESATQICNDITEEDQRDARIVITGATDLGKSSFGRFLINKMLSRESNDVGAVFYLDCDLGQSEFTPPGCISLTEVREPIVGPPFTHLKRPCRCQFFGETSPKDRPYFYIDCIQDVLKYYAKFCSGPLIVNTQGWVKGLGFPLLIDVLRMVKPNVVIQFTSPNNPSKRMCALNDDVVKTSAGWGFQDEVGNDGTNTRLLQPVSARYVEIQAIQGQNDRSIQSGPKVTSADYRRVALLSYFSKLESSSYKQYLDTSCSSLENSWIPRPLEDLVPFQVLLKDVAVHVPGVDPGREMILRALNYSLVGLVIVKDLTECTRTSEDVNLNVLHRVPFGECAGYGIVRNIDIDGDILYILSPEPVGMLQKVNALIKAGIEVPEGLFQEDRKYYQMTSAVQQVFGAKALKPRFNLLRRGFVKNSERGMEKR